MNKAVNVLLVSIIFITGFFSQDIIDEIKKAKEEGDYLYEQAVSKLLAAEYAEWLAVVEKLKSDLELKYRKEGQRLAKIISKKLYLNNVIPYDKRKKYSKAILALIIYVDKKNLQMLTNINNKVSDSKNSTYIWEQILYEINAELDKGRKISDKFVVELLLLLIDRYNLFNKMGWVKEFIRYDDESIRKNALDIISKFSYDDAIEEVTTCLLDNSPAIRSYALDVLATLYAVEKKPFVLKALEDKDPAVRISAIRAARKLGIRDTQSLQEIIKYLYDENIDVVIEVLYTIRYLSLTQYADEVFDIIKNKKIPDSIKEPVEFINTVKLINEAIVTLTYLNYKNQLFKKYLFEKIIPSNEPQLIKFALKAIAYLKFGSKDIIPEIVKILDNPANDKEIQASALYALGYMRQKDVVREYIVKRISEMEYSELESIYEISKNIYSPQLINDLLREYKKEDTTDEDKLYLKKVHIIQILTQFTYSKNVKNAILNLLNREDDVRLVNLMVEGLDKFKLEKSDYALLYKVYKKDMEDRDGYLSICKDNITKLISKIPKYFTELFKDYDDIASISGKKISYLEVLERNKRYLNNQAKRRVLDLIYNSKGNDGYDYSPQIFRAVCAIINLGIDKFLDDNIKNEILELIEKFKDNSKYSSAVLASKLLLLLKGDKNFIDIINEIEYVKGFCQISEYLNLIIKKEFLNDFRKIRFKEQVLSGPLYLIFNILNKKIERKSEYSINYLNLPYDILNRYMLIRINKGDNLFKILQYIKENVGDFTFMIRDNTIVLYTIEQSNQQWFTWYYKNYSKD